MAAPFDRKPTSVGIRIAVNAVFHIRWREQVQEARAGAGELVPIVSIFEGIVIRMYHDEHPPPHFHASCQGFEAFVAIAEGEVIHGRLPRRAVRTVRRWALDHREALMANWELGQMLLPMEMIPGADADD